MLKNKKEIIKKILGNIKWLLSIIYKYAIPSKDISKTPYDYFYDDQIKDCYNEFKEYFSDALFFSNSELIRNYSIRKTLSIISKNKIDLKNTLFLEFGVCTGKSINLFSKHLKETIIHGFDSFEGLTEDWVGYLDHPEGTYNFNKKPPIVNSNVKLIIGKIQDTLDEFLKKNNTKKISFVHIDVDTYETTLFILKKIKPYLNNNCIILFDELYNFSGWKVGEYKALKEVFNKEYKFLAFARSTEQVCILYNSSY